MHDPPLVMDFCVAELLFDCELLTVLRSDHLRLLCSGAGVVELEPGPHRLQNPGVYVAVSGDVRAPLQGLSLSGGLGTVQATAPMKRGEFFSCTSFADVVVGDATTLLHIPQMMVARLRSRSESFARILDDLAEPTYLETARPAHRHGRAA